MIETFVNITGYEGLYQISNLGRVKRVKRFRMRELILKNSTMRNGYKFVLLTKNKKQKNLSIHRLIALHFIPNPDKKPCVNHKDGIKTNNNINNLEWVTSSENQLHALETGLRTPAKGEKCSKAKLTDNDIKTIRLRYKFGSSTEGTTALAKEYGVKCNTIWSIANNKSWKHI